MKDTDQTLKINKEMLGIIITDSQDLADKEKTLIEQLNRENEQLIARQKQIVREREDMAANKLITQQIIEDMKSKEDETTLINEENIKGL